MILYSFIASRITWKNLFFPYHLDIYDNHILISKNGFIKSIENVVYFSDIVEVQMEYFRTGFAKMKIITKWGNIIYINGFRNKEAKQISSEIQICKKN